MRVLSHRQSQIQLTKVSRHKNMTSLRHLYCYVEGGFVMKRICAMLQPVSGGFSIGQVFAKSLQPHFNRAVRPLRAGCLAKSHYWKLVFARELVIRTAADDQGQCPG